VGFDSSKFLCDLKYVVFLKQANGGNAGRAGFDTRAGVLERDSTDGQHRHVADLAGGAQGIDTNTHRSSDLLEDWPEDGKVCTFGLGAADFVGAVAGNGDDDVSRFTFHVSRQN